MDKLDFGYYNMDCMAGMKLFPDKYFDVAIVDPPYGINAPNMAMGTNKSRTKNGYPAESTASRLKRSGQVKEWDSKPPTEEYFKELFRVSKNQIIWGGNYFNLPPTKCFAVWDKVQPWDAFSQAEIAWTSYNLPAKLFRYSNTGGTNSEKRIHPTQKPIALYEYLVGLLRRSGVLNRGSEMKTAETVALEKAIRRATYKMGTFGCYEVTIGYGGKERVDYMTYDTKGIFRCYEVKVSKADFHSAAVKSFVGHYNYYVLTRELYNQVKEEIPDWVGVYIGDYCAKRAKKQDLSGREYKTRRSINGRSTEVSTPWVEMLKESMIRSLYRDSDKLIQTEDEQYISRLRSQIDKARTERDRESKKYLRLWKAVRKEFGDEKAWELIEKAEK